MPPGRRRRTPDLPRNNNPCPKEAAVAITAPVLGESNPPARLFRLVGLLCGALVELNDADRHKMLQLLAAIHALPPSGQIDWEALPDFGNMWCDLYRMHIHGTATFEHNEYPLSDERAGELHGYSASVGTAEASMYVAGVGNVPVQWGYETLDLVLSDRPGLDVYLSGIRAWLLVAGEKLKRELAMKEIGSFGIRDNLARDEQWAKWKAAFLQISRGKGSLPEYSRQIALDCYNLM